MFRSLLKSKFAIALLLLLSAASLSGIVTLTNSVETQSILHQKSLTPVFDLVTQELIKPFYVAETVTRASPLKLRMNETVISEEKIFRKLKILEQEFGMVFFVASERSRTQYNSDGSSISLQPDKVEWYFRAKNSAHDTLGTLGNRNDIHIYFDLKVFNEKEEFLGFIGVGKRLESFLVSFDNFKRQFGYDFVIVDHNNDILLSSDKSQLADGKRILSLTELDWFSSLSSGTHINASHNNQVVQRNGKDYLIAEVQLKALNWRLYLLNPLQPRQADSREAYIIRAISIAIGMLLLLVVGNLLLNYIQTEFVRKHQVDPLTQLPNRASLAWRFTQFRKTSEDIAVIIIDIDYFKAINDTFGHAKGDQVLTEVAKVLHSQIREEDTVGRWGGEEFVMILASSDVSKAMEIAERTRLAIAEHLRSIDGEKLNITASFGVAIRKSAYKLEDAVALADDALYRAKSNGRNQVMFNDQAYPGIKENTPSHA